MIIFKCNLSFKNHVYKEQLPQIWCLLSFPVSFTERLSPDQKAPQFARGSGGLILKPPFEGAQRAAAGPSTSTNVINEDGVQREEVATLKLVDGELVRVVEGSYSYKSPEGIPVSVQWEYSLIIYLATIVLLLLLPRVNLSNVDLITLSRKLILHFTV